MSDSSSLFDPLNPSPDPLNPYGIWSPEQSQQTQQSGGSSGSLPDPNWVPGSGDDSGDSDSDGESDDDDNSDEDCDGWSDYVDSMKKGSRRAPTMDNIDKKKAKMTRAAKKANAMPDAPIASARMMRFLPVSST